MSAEEHTEPVRQTGASRSGGSDKPEPAAPLQESFRVWRAGMGGVWQHKLLWLALIVFTPGWLISIYNWAALPLATPWQLAMVAVTGLILIAVPAAALWLMFRGVSWAALFTVRGYTTVVLWALLGVWLPWQIVWLVFPFESGTMQGAWAAIRFVAADALFSASLLWLGNVLARAKAIA